MERLRKRVLGLKSRWVETLSARDATIHKGETLLAEEAASFKTSGEKLSEKLKEQQQALEAETLEKRKQAEERRKRRANRVKNTCVRIRARHQAQLRAALATLQEKQQEVHDLADEERERKADGLKKQCAADVERLAAFETSAGELDARTADFVKEHRVRLDAVRNKESLEHIPAELEVVCRELTERVAETGELLELSRRTLRRRIRRWIPYLVVTLLHAGAYLYLCGLNLNYLYLYPILGVWVIAMALVYSVYFAAKERVYAAGMNLTRSVNSIRALTGRQRQVLDGGLALAMRELDAERAKRVAGVDSEVERGAEDNDRLAAEFGAKLQAARDKLIGKIGREKEAELVRLGQEAEAAAARLQAQHDETLTQCRAQDAARKREIENNRNSEHARLAAQWSALLAEAAAFAKQEMEQARKGHPPWSSVTVQNLALPGSFHEEVYTGDVHVNLKELVPESDAEGKFSIPPTLTLVLPLVLAFPLGGSLCIRAGLSKREEAMQMLFGVVLRLLCSCPPGKAKLTIIDPVGLGQNFAALMHLADYDETLVNGRIWSDTVHIERKLTELTEHMEKVIQKYLRNRYATIDEYNREAGQMAEPYRFIVIADYPTGFSEVAFERLAGIATSGARCGVYTLILHDTRQKLPASADASVLRRNGPLVSEQDDGFIVDDPSLNRGRFSGEPNPVAAQVDALLNAIGRKSQEAVRVEVPFEAAAPKKEALWSCSASLGVRLPLGKSGADRLQYLELGRGTAQHALIAGKTGSGKSNLFHVIITNAALWYSPDEVEFYLIDFKKGVEFKTYGVHQLPHARVIAIESDREFGLSVLRRVDKELTRRGELYRKARVQDLPSYRKTNPEEHLSRTLLIIDEFQEFFTEEDSVAQDAALLLDRIVRQGRAFGIHVILGSQTLGGTYTLAKSTLGQMAVRIALQCNEADSYLILSDDNAAARLLSRPGEAIYNDMSGLIEGNNPFQAVFLPKEVQDSFLGAMKRHAAEKKLLSAKPTFVFEGNALAELGNNNLLRELAVRGRAPAEAADLVWLGEANAIKGPTEIHFGRQAGSNLLIVGQRSDTGLAMCCTTILALAANNAPKNVRLIVLDGTASESGTVERLAALGAMLPHKLEVVEYRRVPEVLAELAATMKSRQEGTDHSGRRCYLLVLGLQKFRMLRQDDDYAFSSEEGQGAAPAKCFADLLTEGAIEGMHTIVWCDTLGNLNRTVSRKMLREFEMRVLFQMSAGDSSELIDSPAANRLGLYNALLYTTQDGSIEKFRPYASPDAGLLEELSSGLRARK
ncbi:MAG: FtsK/SpoIIIE domain-containing protein [Planctomycetota bacterium]|nr:FtsK/SpoIIIE domain-containing protein [Planctomycetota bacterium]